MNFLSFDKTKAIKAPNCVYCKANFGIFDIKNEENNLVDKSMHSSIISINLKTIDSICRLPIMLNCMHRVCSICVQNHKSDSNDACIFQCPLCNIEPINISSNKIAGFDFELFGYSMYKYYLDNNIAELKHKNDAFTKENNIKNKESIQNVLERFFLFCDHCSDKAKQNLTIENSKQNFGLPKLIDQNNNINLPSADYDKNKKYAVKHCRNCCLNYCEDCYKIVHQAFDKRKHLTLDIFELIEQQCVEHKGLLNHFCPDDKVFICPACSISPNSKHRRHSSPIMIHKSEQRKILFSFWSSKFDKLLLDSNKLLAHSQQENDQNSDYIMTRKLILKKYELIQFIEILKIIINEFNKYSDIEKAIYFISSTSLNVPTAEMLLGQVFDLSQRRFNDLEQFFENTNNKEFNSFTPIKMSTQKQELPSSMKLRQKLNKMNQLNDSLDKSLTTSTRTSSPRTTTNSSDFSNYNFTNFSNYNFKSYEKTDEKTIKCNGAMEVKNHERFNNFELRKSENNINESNLFDIGKSFEFKLVSIVNLSCFYVKNIDVNFNFNDAEEKIPFNLTELNELKKGDLILAYLPETKEWVRAKVLKLIKDECNDTSDAQCNLIDYGFIKTIKIEEIKKANQKYLNIPPLAIKCFIQDIKPYDCDANELNKFEWNANAVNFFIEWIHNRNVLANIKSIKKDEDDDDHFGIDFIYNTGKNQKKPIGLDVVPLFYDCQSQSFSESIVRSKLASYTGGKLYEIKNVNARFMPMNPLSIDEKIIAGVTEMKNLNEFYMKRLYNDEESDMSLLKLYKKMNIEYNGGAKHLRVFDPYEGMPVAVYDENENNWYRAEIVKIHPNNCSVDVMLVDYGTIKGVCLRNVRYLKKEFTIHDVSVFRCRLFGIKITDHTKAYDYVYDTIKDICELNLKTIQVHVKNVIPCMPTITINNRELYEIIIRYPINQKLTNINVMLTKLGFADCANFSIFDGEKEQQKINKPGTVPMLKRTPPVTKLEKELKDILPNRISKVKPQNTVYCKVTNAISPHEIWVQDIVDSENCYDLFQDCLSKKYKQLINEETIAADLEWEEGQLCVMKFGKRDEFYRAKIIEKFSNGKYRILCLDNGLYEINIDAENLFELIEEFNGKPDYKAKKCYLVGVHPLGNSDGEWGSLAKNFTAETLNDTRIHVLFMSDKKPNDEYDVVIYVDGNQKNASDVYPVQTFNNSQYVRFADILNSKGLAFLTEKKQSLQVFLSKALKPCQHLTPKNTHISYPQLIIPRKVYNNLTSDVLYDCLITHLDDSDNIYFNFINMTNKNPNIMVEMYEDFENCFCVNNLDSVEDFKYTEEFLEECLRKSYKLSCVCKFGTRFYRGEILNNVLVNGVPGFSVRLVDYGPKVYISYDDIFRPLEKYKDLKRQAYKFKLTSEKKICFNKELKEMIYNKFAKLKIESIKDVEDEDEDEYQLIADIYDLDSRQWIKQYLGISSDIKEWHPPSPISDEFTERNEPFFKKTNFRTYFALSDNSPVPYYFKIIASWITNLDNIWIQFEPIEKINRNKDGYLFYQRIKENDSKFRDMQYELAKMKDRGLFKHLRYDFILPNSPCICFYKGDESYNRAIIEKVNYIDVSATVRYIDFGNSETVNFSCLFEIDDIFLSLPQQALCCELKDFKLNEKFPKDKSENIISDRLHELLVMYSEPYKLYVKFYSVLDNGKSEVEFWLGTSIDDEANRTLAYKALCDKNILVKRE